MANAIEVQEREEDPVAPRADGDADHTPATRADLARPHPRPFRVAATSFAFEIARFDLPIMLATSSVSVVNPASQQPHVGDADPFVLYARSLHDYTLRLWTESRRIAEEKARIKAVASAVVDRNHGDAPHALKRTNDAKIKA
ncbi:hypothetical protein C8Q80DRAFT_1264620 [Daedaleopsis nitida]|nr:hypothetical protein C8Q80DRAFT_1264620 [Daedaleopsis nitida]